MYGIKIFITTWGEKLEETLKSLGYKSSNVESDVWMKRYFNPNGKHYCKYKYMLSYVDDLTHKCFKPKEDMNYLNLIYRLKEGFGPPDQYL